MQVVAEMGVKEGRGSKDNWRTRTSTFQWRTATRGRMAQSSKCSSNQSTQGDAPAGCLRPRALNTWPPSVVLATMVGRHTAPSGSSSSSSSSTNHVGYGIALACEG